MSSIRTAAIAATALVGLGWVGAANAAIVDLGNAGSPLNIVGISGIQSVTYALSPDTDTRYTSGSSTSTDFPNQSSGTIASGIQTLFGLSATPTFDTGFTNISSSGQTYSVPGGFNFAAVHQDSGEIVFAYATAQTSFFIQGFTGTDGTGDGVQLSNINFFNGSLPTTRSGGTPEPSTWAMMLLGFAGLGYAGFRRSRSPHLDRVAA
jgi:hypothetical protein